MIFNLIFLKTSLNDSLSLGFSDLLCCTCFQSVVSLRGFELFTSYKVEVDHSRSISE